MTYKLINILLVCFSPSIVLLIHILLSYWRFVCVSCKTLSRVIHAPARVSLVQTLDAGEAVDDVHGQRWMDMDSVSFFKSVLDTGQALKWYFGTAVIVIGQRQCFMVEFVCFLGL